MATTNIALPDIGEGVTEGEMIKWLVKVGDTVEADQPVAEVMTDKATVEVPSPVSGTIKELKVKEGDVLPIGTLMALVEAGGAAAGTTPAKPQPVAPPAAEKASAASASAQKSAAPAASSAVRPAPALAASAAQPDAQSKAQANTSGASNRQSGNGMEVYPPPASGDVLATPATRRLAREMGVDINNIQGSGLAGRVTREDLVQQGGKGHGAGATSAGQPTFQIPKVAYSGPAGATEERVALKGIRKKIAENLQMAKHIIPHFTLMDEANVTQLVKFREELKEAAKEKGIKVTYLPFVIKALIATAREFPMFNASIDDAAQEIVYKKYFNIGFAADTPNGLLVPVIKDADRKTIAQLSAEIVDLANRARDGKLKPDEMKGATITITNIGSVGGTYATPIINHPEVAILGMYKIQDRPIIVNGELDVAKVMNFTITADHRLIDGAVAANFLRSFLRKIESPSNLMLEMV